MTKKLDLLLVNVGGSKKRVYQELSRDYSAIEPPFWAALTAGFVRGKGFEPAILDANAENLDFDESVDAIEAYNPGLVQVVCYGQQPAASTQLMSSVSPLCTKIKERNPKRRILLSGLHPSALPRKTMEEEGCDYVAQGEGFHTVLGLLQEKKPEEIPGLWFKDKEIIAPRIASRNIENLTSELGEVAWDLLSWGKYKAHNWQCLGDFESRANYASLSTSLGCVYNCDFCSIGTTFGHERRIRSWSPEWVAEQLEILQKKYGVKVVKLIDEMFVINPRHVEGIAQGIIDRRLKLNLWAYARVDTTREEYLDKLKRAGFEWLCFGFEAGNDEIRKGAEKGKFVKEDIRKVREIVGNHGINIIGNYMFGFPEDTLETMQETLEFSKELNCEFANFYCAMAYPGSRLHDEVVRGGVKLPDSWIGYSQHSYECQPLPTNHVSAAQVLEFRDKAFHEYFTNPRYLGMIEKKFGLESRKHIEGMTKTRLRRKIVEEKKN